jgi:hypothetical protein
MLTNIPCKCWCGRFEKCWIQHFFKRNGGATLSKKCWFNFLFENIVIFLINNHAVGWLRNNN